MQRNGIMLSWVLVWMLCLGAIPGGAHHGRGDTYDTSREVEMHGVVREVTWRNPHIAIYLDVTNDDGSVDTWIIEHSNISQLARLGYGRNSLPAGTEVTAHFNPGTDGKKVGLCQGFILPDGTEIFQRSRLPQELRRGAAGLRPGEVVD